jgi:hypothetical protein
MTDWLAAWDGTVAWDDEVTARHRACILCGAKPDVLEVAVRVVQGLAVSSSTCLRYRKDEAAVRTLLERRYARVKGAL